MRQRVDFLQNKPEQKSGVNEPVDIYENPSRLVKIAFFSFAFALNIWIGRDFANRRDTHCRAGWCRLIISQRM